MDKNHHNSFKGLIEDEYMNLREFSGYGVVEVNINILDSRGEPTKRVRGVYNTEKNSVAYFTNSTGAILVSILEPANVTYIPQSDNTQGELEIRGVGKTEILSRTRKGRGGRVEDTKWTNLSNMMQTRGLKIPEPQKL